MKALTSGGSRRTAAQMHALAAVRREIAASDSAVNSRYLREFTQAFRRYDRVLTPEQLKERVSSAGILLIGDYHALPASQRFAAQLLEELARQRPVVLAVEAVLSRGQPILDCWWRREIPEQELRQRLRFDREWGYEWDPLYELFTSARDHAEGLYGLDCMPRHDLRKIRSRDRHAGAKIAEIRALHPNAVILVLFGESHMAPQHLPALLRSLLPEERMLTVLQNVDSLYWQAVDEHAAAVGIGEDALCVFNASPAEKYESYRVCLERWNGTADDEAPDFAPAVYNLIFALAKSLGFRLDSPRNGTQPRFLADLLPEVISLKSTDGEVAAQARKRLAGEGACATLERLEERKCAYVPQSNTLFIREFHMPYAAAEAARFLHHACRGMTLPGSAAAEKIEKALAHFGSRLLCPENEGCPEDSAGEALYRGYIEGRVSPAKLRQLFLAGREGHVQAVELLAAALKTA